MSISSGPSTIKNGLVFAYDMSNTQKSWRGKPTTNLYGDISTSNSLWGKTGTHFWDGNNWIVSATYTKPSIVGPAGTYLGAVYSFTSGCLSATWSGNSYLYMGKNLTVTAANHVGSGWAYLTPDCNLDYFQATTEASTTDNITPTYGATIAYNLSAKGTWQRMGAGCLSDTNSNFFPFYAGKYGTVTGVFTGTFYCAAPQIETGLIVTPYTSTSRSVTTSLYDLSGNTAADLTNATYDNTGKISYVAAGYVIFPESSLLNTQTPTVEVWAKPTTLNQGAAGGFFFEKGQVNTQYSLFLDPSGYLRWRILCPGMVDVAILASTAGIVTTAYNHIVATYTTGTGSRVYVNGVLVGQDTQTGTITTNANGMSMGVYGGYNGARGYYYNGGLDVVRVYNRALTAAEVSQNFNALRGRYGI